MVVQEGLASLRADEGSPQMLGKRHLGGARGSGMACLWAPQLRVCSQTSAKWPGLGFRSRVAKGIAGGRYAKPRDQQMQGVDRRTNLAGSTGSRPVWLERGRGRGQISIQAAALPRSPEAPWGQVRDVPQFFSPPSPQARSPLTSGKPWLWRDPPTSQGSRCFQRGRSVPSNGANSQQYPALATPTWD